MAEFSSDRDGRPFSFSSPSTTLRCPRIMMLGRCRRRTAQQGAGERTPVRWPGFCKGLRSTRGGTVPPGCSASSAAQPVNAGNELESCLLTNLEERSSTFRSLRPPHWSARTFPTQPQSVLSTRRSSGFMKIVWESRRSSGTSACLRKMRTGLMIVGALPGGRRGL